MLFWEKKANIPPMQEYTVDDFLGGMVRLKQPKKGLRGTSDSVLLAGAVCPKSGESVLDVGCGTGVVALCIGAGRDDIDLTGVEIQSDLAGLARENAALNNQSMYVINADITRSVYELKGALFHHVVTNPPFYNEDPKRANESQERAFKEVVSIKTWIDFCLKHVRHLGTFTMIHRPESLPEILPILSKKCGGITVIPVWPKPNAEPKRVIIRAVLGSKKPFKLHAGLLLHNVDGTRTQAAEDVMRCGVKIG